MAAFHPRTFELLREDLDGETVTNTLDTARLAKLPEGSQSLMAQQLRARIAAFPNVRGDLERLLRFAEDVNRLHADHDAGLHNDGAQRLGCPACIGRDSRSAAAEVLSRTPLAGAFGDTKPEERAR